jgi:CDGSH-type Zn-finger protein
MNTQKPLDAKVRISKDGPYLVSGDLPLRKEIIGTNDAEESIKWQPGQEYPAKAQYALCRCGHSATKPFCDGSHAKVGFDGTETASRKPYIEGRSHTGPNDVADGRRESLRVRALLRSAWPGMESRQRN